MKNVFNAMLRENLKMKNPLSALASIRTTRTDSLRASRDPQCQLETWQHPAGIVWPARAANGQREEPFSQAHPFVRP